MTDRLRFSLFSRLNIYRKATREKGLINLFSFEEIPKVSEVYTFAKPAPTPDEIKNFSEIGC